MRSVLITSLILVMQPILTISATASPTAYTSNDIYLISSLNYQSSAARAALSRQFDSKFSEQAKIIDGLDAQLNKAKRSIGRSKAEAANARLKISELEREIATLKSNFVQELAEKDSEFAREKAVLESATYDLLKTPEGRNVMAVYLSSEPGAARNGILIFQRIAASRNEADKRAIARLGYDSYQKGDISAVEALKLMTDTAPPERRIHNDWYFLSRLYSELGQKVNALHAAEKALETAMTDADRADAHENLGRILIGSEDTKAAAIQFQAAVKLSEQSLAGTPQDFEKRRRHTSFLISLGDAYLALTDKDKALSTYVDAEKIIRELLKQYPSSPILWDGMVSNSLRIGDILKDRKNFDGALIQYQDALRSSVNLTTVSPKSIRYQSLLVFLHRRIGDIFLAKDDLNSAKIEFNDSYIINLDLYKIDSQIVSRQEDLALVVLRLGEVKSKQQDYSGALTNYKEGTRILRKLSEDDPLSKQKRYDLTVVIGRVANMLSEIGDREGTIVHRRDQLANLRKLAEAERTSFKYQDYVKSTLVQLVSMNAPQFTWVMVLDQMEIMQKMGMIVGSDIEYMEDVRKWVADEARSRRRN